MKRKIKEQRKRRELETAEQWSWHERAGRKRVGASKMVTEG